MRNILLYSGLFIAIGGQVWAEPTKEELMQRLEAMTQELELTKAALRESEQKRIAAEQALDNPVEPTDTVDSVEPEVVAAADSEEALDVAAVPESDKITLGDLIPVLEGLEIGGAVRANYVIGDYPSGNGPSRGGNGGNFELDTFRINADYARGSYVGKLEYRWYNGYNMLHTGWLGYDFAEESQLQLGVNRVPFGPGDYGISQSWFFDQHYYVGLSDDMDLGAKYTTTRGDWSIDLAYYYSDEGQWRGASVDSARYSFDVVNESGDGYEERNQFNARIIKAMTLGEVSADVGLSAQYGLLESRGDQGDGAHYAASLHAVGKWDQWTLAPQLTYYHYDVDDHLVQSGAVTNDLIDMGAYDFAWPIATEAWIPAISLSYHKETPGIGWLDYFMPYIEYSSIRKTTGDFNNSDLFIVGVGWGRGAWYIYTDLAFSNGNYFVGGNEFTTFGANPDNDWQTRFNINFGYYF